MTFFDSIWKKLRSSKKYREEFVASHAKRAIPHQARALMKARGWRQGELGENAGLSQGVVSRAIDPSYGNLTLNTIIRLAAGFDVAFIGRFVPFSELAKWTADLPDEDWHIPTFEEEDAVHVPREAKKSEGIAGSSIGEEPADEYETLTIPLRGIAPVRGEAASNSGRANRGGDRSRAGGSYVPLQFPERPMEASGGG